MSERYGPKSEANTDGRLCRRLRTDKDEIAVSKGEGERHERVEDGMKLKNMIVIGLRSEHLSTVDEVSESRRKKSGDPQRNVGKGPFIGDNPANI